MRSDGIPFGDFGKDFPHYNNNNKNPWGQNALILDYILLGWCITTPGISAAIFRFREKTLLSCQWDGKPLAIEDMVESCYLASKLPFFWIYCKIINPVFKLLLVGSTLSYSQKYHNWHTPVFFCGICWIASLYPSGSTFYPFSSCSLLWKSDLCQLSLSSHLTKKSNSWHLFKFVNLGKLYVNILYIKILDI